MPNTVSRGRVHVAAISLSIAGLIAGSGATLAQSSSPVPIGAIDHPTDPHAVVLRYETCCGFTTVEWSLTEAPIFTLYGDNTVIFRPQPPDGMFPGPGGEFPDYIKATLSAAQVDALLTAALGPGGLQDAQELYINPLIADAPSTIFTVDAAGIKKVVTIQALSEISEGPDQAERARFYQLADLLDSFEEQVAAGNVLSSETFQPASYRGMLTEVWEGAVGTPVEWPWADIAPEDFVGPEDGLARYLEMTPEQVDLIADIPNGGQTNIMVETPDGETVYFNVRPLLPGEPALPEGVEAAA